MSTWRMRRNIRRIFAKKLPQCTTLALFNFLPWVWIASRASVVEDRAEFNWSQAELGFRIGVSARRSTRSSGDRAIAGPGDKIH